MKRPHWFGRSLRPRRGLLALVLLAACLPAARGAEPVFAAAADAVKLDRQLDWQAAALIVVQDANRYKTLDSFARESLAAVYGRERLPGLSPLASLCELLFNRAAYEDTPFIRIRDKGLQIHLSEPLPEAARQRIRATGFMTPRELRDPKVQARIEELEPKFAMSRAINRVRGAEAVANFLERLILIVPHPGAPADALWFSPLELRTNAALALDPADRPSTEQLLRELGNPAPDVTPAQAVAIFAKWLNLERAWQARDAAGVQAAFAQLAQELPKLAAPGVYPSTAQRAAEAHYYASFIGSALFSRASLGWLLYLLGALVSVAALVTRWQTPRYVALALLVLALSWHAYGLALRWYIVGRIPVANMFEAITASAWIGIALALVVELIYRTRVFLLAAHVTGFFALVVAGYVLPMMGSGGGEITSIMGILDDLMLRIHTVLIIASYALIFLAAVIAAVYLFGYYFSIGAVRSAQAGLLTALVGGCALTALSIARAAGPQLGASGYHTVQYFAAGIGVLALSALPLLIGRRTPGLVLTGTTLLVLLGLSTAFGGAGFGRGLAWTLVAGGIAWAACNAVGYVWQTVSTPLAGPQPAGLALAAAGDVGEVGLPSLRSQRPVLAGGAPGDEGLGARLPVWLHHADWSHLIILNMAFVMLFVGIILGAVWADYSWGRPWGWDPKETFAINTWIIYAILIHARFIVRRKGLWTAWLSIAGCAMMAFNWFVVNFYIVGLHSYA